MGSCICITKESSKKDVQTFSELSVYDDKNEKF